MTKVRALIFHHSHQHCKFRFMKEKEKIRIRIFSYFHCNFFKIHRRIFSVFVLDNNIIKLNILNKKKCNVEILSLIKVIMYINLELRF